MSHAHVCFRALCVRVEPVCVSMPRARVCFHISRTHQCHLMLAAVFLSAT